MRRRQAILPVLPGVERGRDPLKQWQVRPVAAEVLWVGQQARWRRVAR